MNGNLQQKPYGWAYMILKKPYKSVSGENQVKAVDPGIGSGMHGCIGNAIADWAVVYFKQEHEKGVAGGTDQQFSFLTHLQKWFKIRNSFNHRKGCCYAISKKETRKTRL